MFKKGVALLLAIFFTFGVVASASDDIFPPLFEFWKEDSTVTIIVEVEGEPSGAKKFSAGRYSSRSLEPFVPHEQAEVISLIREDVSQTAQPEFVYTTLLNGFSMEVKESDIEKIEKIPGVKKVYISRTTMIADPMLHTSEVLASVTQLADIGYAGAGTAIAVIDGFCDVNHSFFDCELGNPKFTESYINSVLESGSLNASKKSGIYKSSKIPFVYNYVNSSTSVYSSSIQHGTHVSGIVAGFHATAPDGETSFSGVAPHSQLLFMNCANSQGGLGDNFLLAAMEDAVLLGVDVINLSLGFTNLDSSISVIIDAAIAKAKEHGILVFAAAGNKSRGYNFTEPATENIDYSTTSVPAAYSSPTAVGSVDNTHVYSTVERLLTYDELKINAFNIGSSAQKLSSLFSENTYIEYEDCGIGNSSDFEGKNLTGKIALVKRGDITLAEKAQNAKDSGAVGIIIVNNEEQLFSASSLALPALGTVLSEGTKLIEAENKSLTYIGTKTDKVPSSSGGSPSYFSSWGVDSALELKPEITAPGGNIYSSIPNDKFKADSGTSMASPHAAGISLLALEYYNTAPFIPSYNNLTGADRVNIIENIMMNSATVLYQENGVCVSPRLQGAGLVNAEAMINSKVIIHGNSGKAKVSLGELSESSFDVSFKITNISENTVVFDKISLELLTDGYETTGGKNYVSESVSLPCDSIEMPEAVTLAAGEEYDFTASVKLNEAFLEENSKVFTNGFFVDGFVFLEADDFRASLPFTGFYGNWFDSPIFDSTIYDEGSSTLLSPSTNQNDRENRYNTGTFIAIGTDSSYYIAGKNPFKGLTSSDADSRYLSYSPALGYDVYLSYKMLRPISKLKCYVYNSNGEVIHTEVAPKDVERHSQDTLKLGLSALSLAEGNYTLKFTANYISSSYENDSVELPIFIDKTAPVLSSLAYNHETDTLSLKAKDNHYLAGFVVKYTDASGNMATTGCTAGAEDVSADGYVTKHIKLEDAADSPDITVSCVDYAQNIKNYSLNYYTNKMGLSVNSLTMTKEKATAKLVLRNNTRDFISKDIIIGFYDSAGKLLTAIKQSASFTSGEEKQLTFSSSDDLTDSVKLSVFVWDIPTLIPFDRAKSFSIKPAS